MGEGHIVEAAERTQMTPRQRRKYDKKIAKEEKKKEKIDKRRNISEDYTPQSSKEYADKYTQDMDRMIEEDESKKRQENIIKEGSKMLRNRNYFKEIPDDDDSDLIADKKEENNNDGGYIPQTQRTE